MKALGKKGYYVTRSAGSHGLIDLVVFVSKGIVWGVQCKRNYVFSESDKYRLVELAKKYGFTPYLASKNKGKIVLDDLSR